MNTRIYEIVVDYDSGSVFVLNTEGKYLVVLEREHIKWFSDAFTSVTAINGTSYSITDTQDGIELLANDLKIGEVQLASNGYFKHIATIVLEKDIFLLKRDSLKQSFLIIDSTQNLLIQLNEELHRKKQMDFLWLVRSVKKHRYLASFEKNTYETTTILFLLTVCGYCTRLFLEMDTGEYTGTVHRLYS